MKEFNLSDKILTGPFYNLIWTKNVKEFIRINLKDLKNVRTDSDLDDFIERFKKRAGKELTSNEPLTEVKKE